MQIIQVGLSQKTAPIELRERLALCETEVPATFSMSCPPYVQEAAILSTWRTAAFCTGSRVADRSDLAMQPLSEEHGLNLPVALFALCLGLVAMLLVAGMQRLLPLIRDRLRRRREETGNTELKQSHEARENRNGE